MALLGAQRSVRRLLVRGPSKMGIEKDLDELFSYDTVCSIAARDAEPGALAVAFVLAVPNACQRLR